MIGINEEVMNMIVRGGTTSNTAAKWDEPLGASYDLVLEIEVEEMPAVGTTPTSTVKVHTSNTGKRWKDFATVVNGESLASLPYEDFATPIEEDLTTTGPTWVHVAYFTRWFAWFSAGTLESDAEVTVDLIARE